MSTEFIDLNTWAAVHSRAPKQTVTSCWVADGSYWSTNRWNHSLAETRQAMRKLKVECQLGSVISVHRGWKHLWTDITETRILGFYMMVLTIWQFSAIPPDWKELVAPLWKEEGYQPDCNSCHTMTLPYMLGKVLVHLPLKRILFQLVNFHRSEQCGYVPS